MQDWERAKERVLAEWPKARVRYWIDLHAAIGGVMGYSVEEAWIKAAQFLPAEHPMRPVVVNNNVPNGTLHVATSPFPVENALRASLQREKELREELAEQSRLLGMGGSREAALLARVSEKDKEIAALKAQMDGR